MFSLIVNYMLRLYEVKFMKLGKLCDLGPNLAAFDSSNREK